MLHAQKTKFLPVFIAWVWVLASAHPARAAEIVALELQAVGGVRPQLAAALSPVLITELSRRDGMSVVSQADIRALLELEADKATLGCDNSSCMAEIASSMGAELLASSTLSRVGEEYIVAMTLLQVEGARVIRRSTGKARGGDEAAGQAVAMAVHELFRGELPTELQGPASMTRRGFEASLAGLQKAIAAPKTDAKPGRKRVILDLITTELDYDAEPKLQTLEKAIERGIFQVRQRALGAKDGAELEHWLGAADQYRALRDDLGRVREIRTRARERGIEPSARALRFLDPDPEDRPSPTDVARYFAATQAARRVLDQALQAYLTDEPADFSRFWKSTDGHQALRAYESGRDDDRKYGVTWQVLPAHAHTPELLARGIRSIDTPKLVLYRLKKQGAERFSSDPVYLEQEGGAWRIVSW